jgi:hypothetical protein
VAKGVIFLKKQNNKSFDEQMEKNISQDSQSHDSEYQEVDPDEATITVVNEHDAQTDRPDGLDDEDFRETIEAQLPESLMSAKKNTEHNSTDFDKDRRKDELSAKMKGLIEEQDEILRRVSMSIGDSQLALRNSDFSLKEVKSLKSETKKLISEMREHIEHFAGDVSDRLQSIEKIDKFEKLCTELADRLINLEVYSDQFSEKHSSTTDMIENLTEELSLLKEKIDEATGRADTALEKENKLEEQ